MFDGINLKILEQIADGICAEFGDNCEVAIHDLTSSDLENTIVYINNGHVTNRKVGDGPSQIVLDAIKHHSDNAEDKLAYLTRTRDGKILKSSTMYIRGDSGEIVAILAINFDITSLLSIESALTSLTYTEEKKEASSGAAEPANIPLNVNDLLEELITQSIRLVGKPVALMTKEDKIKAIQFLNESGAFLITRSGDKVSNTFGISKFTLYSYMDAGK